MSCNSCAKPYTLFRKEKGCPSCGFSFCSKCLVHKTFVNKLNTEAKVCAKCVNASLYNQQKYVEPPDAYLKRIGVSQVNELSKKADTDLNDTEKKIEKRLQSLKEDRNKSTGETSDERIKSRLQNLKGTQPSTSDAEMQLRLANLKGIPIIENQNKPIICTQDFKTEQEQADELLKCYMEQGNIDKKYKEGFDKNIEDIESRILKLKGVAESKKMNDSMTHLDSDDDDIEIKKIIEKVKAESLIVNEEVISPSTNDELPFCEICNEDAKMRCLGCQYLFCKRCFMEHKDDDDGCNRYEFYEPSKSSSLSYI